MSVIRVKNPRVVDIEDVDNLLKATFSTTFPVYANFEKIRPALKETLFASHVGFFLGFEDGIPKGVAIVLLPTSELETVPQVYHLYSNGTISLRKELIQAVVDFVKESGYTRFWALNNSGRSDKALMRTMKPKGWKIAPQATVMRFEVDE